MEQTIEINKVIMGGLGLGRAADGMAVMVAGVLPGETVTVTTTRAHRGHLEARLVRVEAPSPDRITPPCPLYATCGGCSGAPSFAGLQEVADLAPCGGGGLTLFWHPAAAWGSGAAGLYNVYRGTSADFVPGPGNRIASGVHGTSYPDVAAPVGQAVWYVVRAENDETCGGGPLGGVEDQNLVRLPGTETVDRPDPGLVDGSLRADPVNHAHVRLSWAAVPNADRYRVQRGLRADLADAILLGETAQTTFEDAGALTDLRTYFYRVTALGACD